MAKIESIRPGGTLEARLSTYPLADLLIGILRGNLSGRLELLLHPESRNFVFFKDGVPVSVVLPDSGVSLIKVLIDSGEIAQRRGLELMRSAEASGVSEEAMLEANITAGMLEQARRRRARVQLVRMFDARELEIRFVEGSPLPNAMPLTILQPLPLLFEGLFMSKDDVVLRRFLKAHRHSSFVLAGTYPSGIDPFEWGPKVESIITGFSSPFSVQKLMQAGLPENIASVVLASLDLAKMLELREQGAGLRETSDVRTGPSTHEPPMRTASALSRNPSAPRAASQVPRPTPSKAVAPTPSGGLMIHRRSGSSQSIEAVKLKSTPHGIDAVQHRSAAQQPTVESVDVKLSPHEAEQQAIRARLVPLVGQNYFQILRVTPESTPPQIERAYRFLLRRVDELPPDPGWNATKDLLAEAFDVLETAHGASRYAELLSEAEKSPAGEHRRRAFEAEPKIERAVRAMAQGRSGEAAFLLSWAFKLDGQRRDVPLLRAFADFLRSASEIQRIEGPPLLGDLKQFLATTPGDWRVRMCAVIVQAALGNTEGAEAFLKLVPDQDHPLVKLARVTVQRNHG